MHKPIPHTTAMNILEAKAALDNERTKLQKLPAWHDSQVTSKSRGDTQRKIRRQESSFATLMDLCHLKYSELENQLQKYKGRVVLKRSRTDTLTTPAYSIVFPRQ